MPSLKYPIPRLPSPRTLASIALANADNRDWYRYANTQILHAATHTYHCTPTRLADLLSLFSPRVAISRSVRFTHTYLTSNKRFEKDVVYTIRASVRHYEATGKIRGPKTAPFARALMLDPHAIVLDTHMGSLFGIDSKRFEVKMIWNECASRIRSAAKLLGWQPAETQAAIWAGALRLMPHATIRQLELPIGGEAPSIDLSDPKELVYG